MRVRIELVASKKTILKTFKRILKEVQRAQWDKNNNFQKIYLQKEFKENALFGRLLLKNHKTLEIKSKTVIEIMKRRF